MGFSKKAFVNVGWSGLLRGTLRSLTFVKLAILARILTPSDFGSLGIASLVLAFLEILTETGINVFLIQERKNLKIYLDTAYVVSILRGIIISLVVFLFSKPISIFFNSPTSLSLLYLISIVPLIRGFINPAAVRFKKELQFKKEYFLQTVIFAVDTAVAISISFLTKSPIGLVWGMVAGAFSEVVLTQILISPKPKLKFNKVHFRKVINSGKWLTAAGIFNYLFENVDDMVVGKILPNASLGIYQMAYKICSLPITEVSTIVNRVSLPVFVQIREDKKRLLKAYLKSTFFIFLIIIPIGLILSFWPEVIIKLLLGEKWLVAVEVVRIMAFFGILRAISISTYPVFLALKRQDIVSKITLANILFLILGLVFLIEPLGIIGAGFAAIIGAVVGIPISIYYLYKVLKI